MGKFSDILGSFQELFNAGMNAATFGLWNNLLQMLNITVGGFSLRKFSALCTLIAGLEILLRHSTTDPQSTMHALICFGYSLLSQQLITAQQIIEFKNGAMPTASGGMRVVPPAPAPVETLAA